MTKNTLLSNTIIGIFSRKYDMYLYITYKEKLKMKRPMVFIYFFRYIFWYNNYVTHVVKVITFHVLFFYGFYFTKKLYFTIFE